MRPSPSTARRASNGALRAVDAERDGANAEPFGDVSEPVIPDRADPEHGLNGRHAKRVASDTPHEPLSPDDPLAPLPFNPYKGNRGLTRAWHAMKNSLAGFRVAIREESAFRQELTLAAILVPCALLVPVEPVARVLLLGSVLLVLIVELLNSSVEAAIDRISLERHELSRRAKDLGSAAVMVTLGMCVMTWLLIVGPLVVHWIDAWG
ncbi:diacylglycerol kinase [Paraburkholderia ribeironis]|nr:diacylglycerol kinase [Paraburkholderia ribeironis]